MQRVLELLMPIKEIDLLFKTTRSKVTVQKSGGVMGAFLTAGKKSLAKCEVCGEQCEAGNKLCRKHIDSAQKIAQQKRESMLNLKESRDETIQTCYDCQRYKAEVLCVNMDCKVFFKRTKLQAAYVRAEEQAKTFYTAQKLSIDW